MQPDHPRVEVGQHGDAADHALPGDAQADRQGQQDQGPAAGLFQQSRHETGQGDGDQHEGEQAVAELDHAVHAHRGRRRVGIRGTAGPGRAAQAGAGEPDRRAGDDQRGVGDQGRERQRA
jgi:hypothetical protein